MTMVSDEYKNLIDETTEESMFAVLMDKVREFTGLIN
jgi:hypothetical protein